MKRRFPIDWRMVLGFGGLLSLVLVIGLIGVRQIEMLNSTVTHLARVDIPLQNAVQEMKSSNNKYAIGIRSYIFWKSARYLDAAAVAKTDLTSRATENFERNIAFYASQMTEPEQRAWVATTRESQEQLRAIGVRIMRLADASATADGEAKAAIIDDIRRTLMEFENKLFQIEGYLDETLLKHNLAMIDGQLMRAKASRDRSVKLLFGSLAIALALGVQMAYLTYRRSKRDSEHRELLCRTVIRVEEEQKNNLSLQVHDQMGQDLSAMKIYLGLIEGDLSAEANEQRDRIGKIKRIVDALMQKTHNISELLRPPELDDLGLSESLEALVAQEFRNIVRLLHQRVHDPFYLSDAIPLFVRL
ncbi:MAG: sensor histidine kinase, partial [Deltaproteobacteria bacterium]